MGDTVTSQQASAQRIAGRLGDFMADRTFRLEFKHEPPRLVRIHLHGQLDADGAVEAMDALETAIMGEPYFLLEVDINDLKGVVPEARRIVAERVRQMPSRSIAIVGGGFAQRVVAKLVLTAISRLGGGAHKTQGGNFATSELARKWLFETSSRWE